MASLNPPLYMQIYNRLKEDILAMKYSAGKRLPTEKELCDMYHVSRITSKNALNMLAEENLIVRIKGKGSFVPNMQNCIQQNGTHNKKPKIIGVILPEIEDYYGKQVFITIEEQCKANGFLCVFSRSANNQAMEEQALKEMLNHGVSGIIIMPVFGMYYNAKILRLILDKFPVVVIDRELRGIPSHFVGTDNISAAETAMDYLINSGHKKIGVYTAPIKNTASLEDRIEGIYRSLAKNNVAIDSSLFFSQIRCTLSAPLQSTDIDHDKNAIAKHITEHKNMTAVFALVYDVAMLIKSVLKKLDINDMEIVCFDSPKHTPFDSYNFTHVKQNEEEIGKKAFNLLLSLITGGEQKDIVKININASLIFK